MKRGGSGPAFPPEAGEKRHPNPSLQVGIHSFVDTIVNTTVSITCHGLTGVAARRRFLCPAQKIGPRSKAFETSGGVPKGRGPRGPLRQPPRAPRRVSGPWHHGALLRTQASDSEARQPGAEIQFRGVFPRLCGGAGNARGLWLGEAKRLAWHTAPTQARSLLPRGDRGVVPRWPAQHVLVVP